MLKATTSLSASRGPRSVAMAGGLGLSGAQSGEAIAANGVG